MRKLLDLLFLSTAAWRISSLLVKEAGPSDIFARLRYKAGVRYNEYSQPVGRDFISSLFVCIWCMSVWVSYILYLFYKINKLRGVYEILIYPLFISTSVIWLHRQITEK